MESSDQQSAKRRKVKQHPPSKHAKDKSKAEQHLLSKSSGRPSENWPSLDDSYDAVRARKIEDIISTGNWTYLCSQAVKHYASAQAVTCVIDRTRFARGMENVVFEVAFSNSTYWVVRIRLSDVQEVETEMLSEIATIRLIQQRTSIPLPTIFAYNSDKENPFGFRYMLMNALPGKVLDDRLSRSIPEQHKIKVAGQLAKYLYELSLITFDKIGRIWCGNHVDENPRIISFPAHGEYNGRHALCTVGPFNTSRSYFRALRQGVNKAVQVEHSDNQDWPTWSQACQVLTDAIPSLFISKYQRGPFPLWNLDWHYNNTLLDDEFNITGLLDWSAAQTVPVEQFAVSPEFITLPGLSEEGNRPIVEFRAMFVKAWKEIETELLPATPLLTISDVISSTIPDLVYRCISSFPRHSRSAMIHAELVLRLLNSDAEHAPSASNSPYTRIDGQVLRPKMGQALRRSNRKSPQRPLLVASKSLSPFYPSKGSKAAQKTRLMPRRRPNISKKVSVGALPRSSSVDAAQPQPSPVSVNLRRSPRLQPPISSVARGSKRTIPSKSKQNSTDKITASSSAKPQGLSKRPGAETTGRPGKARKE